MDMIRSVEDIMDQSTSIVFKIVACGTHIDRGSSINLDVISISRRHEHLYLLKITVYSEKFDSSTEFSKCDFIPVECEVIGLVVKIQSTHTLGFCSRTLQSILPVCHRMKGKRCPPALYRLQTKGRIS